MDQDMTYDDKLMGIKHPEIVNNTIFDMNLSSTTSIWVLIGGIMILWSCWRVVRKYY